MIISYYNVQTIALQIMPVLSSVDCGYSCTRHALNYLSNRPSLKLIEFNFD